MSFTLTISIPDLRRIGSRPLPATEPAAGAIVAKADRVVAHFVRRGLLRADSRAAGYLRSIFAAPSDALRVHHIERRLNVSRRTLARHLRVEGLPVPRDWTALARALYAHRTFVRGGSLQRAAYAAGYPDTFTMSAVFLRITGFRPSRLREVDQAGLLDLWIMHQRERGKLTGAPPAMPRTCPICGGVRAG